MRFLVAIMILTFLLGGLGLFVDGLRAVIRKFRRRPYLRNAEGVILNVHRETRTSTTPGYRMHTTHLNFPVIRFHTASGEQITFRSSSGDTGNSSRFHSGQKLQVLYDPNDPGSATINSWSALWLGSLLEVLAGVLFMGAAIVLCLIFGDRIIGKP